MSVKFTAGFLTQTQADALNRLFAKPGLGDVWATPPLQMVRGPGGQPGIALPPPESWWAKLTDEDAGAWTHEEWWEITPGVWEKKPLGESGTLDAYPVPGTAGDAGLIVRMWKSRSVPDVYEFDPNDTSSGLWARITAQPSADPGPYTGVGAELIAGVWQDKSPTVSYTTIYRATNVPASPLIPVGQYVRLNPSPTMAGAYECYTKGGGDTSFWAEITAGPTSLAYSWKKVKQVAGVWSDVSPTVSGSLNAYATEVDGVVPTLSIGSMVRMWASQTAAGKYECELCQNASYTVPGLMSTGTQTFRGDKTFRCDLLTVVGDLSSDVAFTVGSLGALTVGQVGTDMTVDLLGGNSDAGAGIVSVGGGVSASAYTVRYDYLNGASLFISINGLANLYLGASGNFNGLTFDAWSYDPTTQIFIVGGTAGSLRVSDDVRVDAAGTYWVGADQGISFTYSVLDDSGGTQSMTWTGGILTDQTYTPGPPTVLGAILADGGIDGGTF